MEQPFLQSDRAKLLYASLTQSLRLEAVSYQVANQVFELLKVENIDELLDNLITLDDDDINIVDERLPYWADLWPAAIGLSTYLLKSTDVGPGTRVLEIGCGMGLCGIVAARKGAEVAMTDYLPEALELAELNALRNLDRPLRFQQMDWREPDTALRADILLASDVAYENRAFQPLLDAFESLLLPGGKILLSEPRRDIARPFLAAIPEKGYQVSQHLIPVEFQHREVGINVYEIQMPD